MQELIDGYHAFRNGRWPAERQRYLDLAKHGQKPQTLVITCSDSRSDPATIFNASPGSMFVIRNVAAIVPPYETDDSHHGTSAAIAFAVLNLEVRNILVMGHAQCGGVSAALDNSIADGVPFLRAWVDLLKPAVDRLPEGTPDAHTLLERDAVRLSLEQLMSFPFVAERVNAGKLELNGARFGIADGKLELLDKKTGKFAAL
ncbi:MAG TPA: carbonic anhydrase [Rhizomicrobium sp.]|jgi:carbonic anhydrase